MINEERKCTMVHCECTMVYLVYMGIYYYDNYHRKKAHIILIILLYPKYTMLCY